ncbi:LysR family transcriptional regulator [beta proteobacterium MWH-UniP1]
MRLDPVSLRFFLAVMEEGNIARAASRELIAASAVSKRISELEAALGAELFYRDNKGVRPTAAAQTLAAMARGVLHQLDSITEEMRGYATGLRGHVRVFANISAITQFLPDQLKQFLERYPDVQIHLQERISSEVAHAVVENVADVGFLQSGDYGAGLTLIPYITDELVVIAKASHPIAKRESVTIDDILAYDVVGAHTGSAINNLLIKAAGEVGGHLKLRIQVTSYDAMSLMVSAGLGIGVMPRKSARLFRESQDIVCVTINAPWAIRQLSICIRDQASLSPAAKMLVDCLLEGNSLAARGLVQPGSTI